MNPHLFTMIVSIALALFNLFGFIQHKSGTSFILLIVWLFVGLRSFKQLKAKNDENSENNA